MNMKFPSYFIAVYFMGILPLASSESDALNRDDEIQKIKEGLQVLKERNNILEERNNVLEERLHVLEERNDVLEVLLQKKIVMSDLPSDCLEILQNNPNTPSGLQVINIGRRELTLMKEVFCDMETDGGGWTVIQRRFDGNINFYRDYETYARGFGLNFHEFWFGNEHLHLITSRINYELRADLENYDGQTAYAKYSKFSVDSACDGFRLHLEGYSGTAGDSLAHNNGNMFSTYDRDQDSSSSLHCAVDRQGAWWYNYCSSANPNGMYLRPGAVSEMEAAYWWDWFRDYRSMKSIELKIRPAFPKCPL